jgi:hypothetical protein
MSSPPAASAGVELAELADLAPRPSEVVAENRRKSLVRMSQDFRGITLQEPLFCPGGTWKGRLILCCWIVQR